MSRTTVPGSVRVTKVPRAPMRMPDFLQPVRLGRHGIDSALSELRSRGVPDDRVRVHAVSAGGGQGTVVGQSPAPGAQIDLRDGVHLYAELTPLMDRLPYAMRDEEPDAFGTDQVLGLFDSSAAHAGHYLRLGGDLFALRDGDERGARRWLEEIFAIDPARFGRARWYRLVRFAARLHAIAGRADAAAIALRALYGISSKIVRLDSVPGGLLTKPSPSLGDARSQLGFSTILGGEPVTPRRLVLQVGPVPLSQFEQHRDLAMYRERKELYRLCLPFWISADVTERWIVIGPEGGMRFGADAGSAPRLGWTSYLSDRAHVRVRDPSQEKTLVF
jgi:hypothetical protein